MPAGRDGRELTSLIRAELEKAHGARAEGNEGRARVCARRAAGWAVQTIHSVAQPDTVQDGNAYRMLEWFQSDEQFPVHLREAAMRLTTRVRHDSTLPFDQDLLEDAELIVRWVLRNVRE